MHLLFKVTDRDGCIDVKNVFSLKSVTRIIKVNIVSTMVSVKYREYLNISKAQLSMSHRHEFTIHQLQYLSRCKYYPYKNKET